MSSIITSEATWFPMSLAPKDRPLFAYYDHGADPYFLEDNQGLTIYGGWTEGLSCLTGKGYAVVVWGGGYYDGYEDGYGSAPDWWFTLDSEFEVVVNPVMWLSGIQDLRKPLT